MIGAMIRKLFTDNRLEGIAFHSRTTRSRPLGVGSVRFIGKVHAASPVGVANRARDGVWQNVAALWESWDLWDEWVSWPQGLHLARRAGE